MGKRIYDDPKRKRQAQQAAKKKYEKSGKRKKEGAVRIRSTMRIDKQVIREHNLPDEWRVDIIDRLSAPPLPFDLAGLYAGCRGSLYCQLSDHPLWIRAFLQEEHLCRDWITNPPLDRHDFDDIAVQYDELSLDLLFEGWYVRRIINYCQQRWLAPFKTDGTIDKVALVRTTRELLKRMNDVLAEVSRVNDWCSQVGLAFGDRGSQMLRRLTIARGTCVQCRSQDHSKSSAIAFNYRYHLYQELVLLRSELWDRYHLRHDQLIKRFLRRQLSWQRCWFQQDSVSVKVKDCIQGVIDDVMEPFSSASHLSTDKDTVDDSGSIEEEDDAEPQVGEHFNTIPIPSQTISLVA